MALESSGIEKNSQSNQTRRWLIVGVALVVILTFIATGFYFLSGAMKNTTPAQLVPDSPDADFGYGVATVNEHPIPEGGVALASDIKGDSVRSVIITGSGLDAKPRQLDTWGGNLRSEFIPTDFPGSLTDILQDPYYIGLCPLLNRPCSPEIGDPATADGVALIGIGRLWWEPEESKWVSETQGYEANLIFGTLGDYLIGNRTNGEYAGYENTSTIPVDSITAFSIATGEPVWTKELPHPGFVTVGANSITVVETPVGSVDPPDYTFAEDTYIYVEQLTQASSDLQIYELVAATKDNTEVVFSAPPQASATAPILSPKAIDKVGIKNYEFANGYFPNIFLSEDRCQPGFWHYDDEINNGIVSPSAFNKVPMSADEVDSCYWYTMSAGNSVEMETIWGETMPALMLNKRGSQDESAEFELAPGGELDDTWFIAYQDINGDGYLDAIIPMNEGGAIVYYAAIFDPETPDFPFITYLWGTQSEMGRLTEDGYFELSDGDCVTGLIGITGIPPRYTTYEIANLTAGECL